MEKLSQTSYRQSRKSWDKTNTSYLAQAADKKIRNIIHTRKSGSFLDTVYVYTPQEKIQLSDSFEVASQLSALKTLMDRERSTYTKGDVRLTKLKSEGLKIDEVVELRKNIFQILAEKIASIENQMQQVLNNQSEEENNQTIYLHVLDRMRTTLVFLKRKYRGLEKSLYKETFELNQETKKSTKAKETKVITSIAFSHIRESVILEKKSKQIELEKVQKDVKKCKELSEKRLIHKQKQKEMMEKVMIEDQSHELEEMREKYLLHFLWYMLSSMKFEKEQVKWKRYEDAFFRIKIATGIQEVPVLVEKFLTKETIYAEFLSSVKKKEIELAEFREKIENMQNSLEKLHEIDPTEFSKGDKDRNQELMIIRKLVLEENSKMKALLMIKTKIKDWCLRYQGKISKVCDINLESLHDKTIKQCMEIISKNISQSTKSLKDDMEKSNSIKSFILKQTITKIVEKIPQTNRIKSKVSELNDFSELSHIEPITEEHLRRHK
ncbi:hypothetical protein SteCoe_19986 [Stentor coeruleus]|uniref:DUF4200 domain-containing protein n=1 Tax=Stentor coeruleus TaxID=5963 RepID=A0A1R2BSV2_9CILI|nr:hypothetical protein SteCoe_19986 [Stentor coeruleus]